MKVKTLCNVYTSAKNHLLNGGPNQIIFIGLRSSKGYYKRPGGDVGVWEGSLGCEFMRGSMCAEGMVLGGGALDGYFGEQGLPVGIQECLERFHRGCVDYLSWKLVPKWDCPNGDGASCIAVGGT